MTQSYEAFASEPEYLELNRHFIDVLSLDGIERVLDLACGTGTLTFHLLDAIESGHHSVNADAPKPAIIGLDISRESLDLARLQWNASYNACAPGVTFVQASVDDLPFAPGTFDLVLVGNAIQLFENKDAVVRGVHHLLRGRGIFAFNTSFYAGTFVAGTERFYLNWVQESYRYVAEHVGASNLSGPSSKRRRKESARPAFSRPWLSKEEYTQLLIENGFEIQSITERVAMMTEHSFQSIGSYAGLASVLLSGYPPELASEALAKSAGRALASAGLRAVPRNWVEFIATRG